MPSLSDLTQRQLTDFEDVREAWKGLKGHVQFSVLSELITLYKEFGSQVLCTAIRVMLWLDWNRLIDLKVTAKIVKKFGTERVLKALENMGDKKWHSPESLEKYLSGSMPVTRGPANAQTEAPWEEYCRQYQLYPQGWAIDWLVKNGHKPDQFEEFFDRAGFHPTYKYNNKPMLLFKLKEEYA